MLNRCILILSCDKYADLWQPFFLQFRKYWSDCPYPVYLGSNTVSYSGNLKVKTILSGQDKDWSTSFIAILKQIPEKSISLILDDMFLTSKVNNRIFEDSFNFLEQKNNQHIHFGPSLPPDKHIGRGLFGLYTKGAPYRVNSLGLWRKQSLLNLLLPGESPWNFEIQGSYRSSYQEGFYCSIRPMFDYLHVVEKGKILPDAYTYCLQHGIVLPKDREVISAQSKIKSDIQRWYFQAILKIPWRWRLDLMWQLRKLLVSY